MKKTNDSLFGIQAMTPIDPSIIERMRNKIGEIILPKIREDIKSSELNKENVRRLGQRQGC